MRRLSRLRVLRPSGQALRPSCPSGVVHVRFSSLAEVTGKTSRNRHGLTTEVAYTYSHEIDEVSNDLSSVSNPFNIAYDRGSGALDRRQIFNVNYIYAAPWFTKNGNAFQRIVLGGAACSFDFFDWPV